MNLNEHLPALLLAVPLLGAFTAPIFSLGGKFLRNAALLAATFLTLVVAFLLWRHVSAAGVAVYVMGAKSAALTLPSGMKFPIRIILEVDAFSAFMALTGAIASFAGALFSLNYMNRFTGLNRFVSLYCLLTAGMLGMMVTGDLFNFFVFFEVASIASFGLIAFWHRGELQIRPGLPGGLHVHPRGRRSPLRQVQHPEYGRHGERPDPRHP